jgi:FkbM family methyltransferase
MIERLTALALCLAVLAGACSKQETQARNPNRVPDPVLAPTLLLDNEEIEKFISEFPRQDYQIVDVEGVGRFYLDDNPASVKQQLRAGKPWEPEVLQVMARHTLPGSTALDVGAHIGSHTLTLARLVGPDGAVYAFEPQKKVYRELVKNLELNDIENTVPLRFAVGAQHRIIEMTPTRGQDGRMRVGRGGDRAELRPIDSFGFSNVSLIKIDVEGHELHVLEGAQRTIREWHPAIVIEIMGSHRYDELPPRAKQRVDAVKTFLARNGYRLQFVVHAGEPHFLALYEGDR